MIILRAPDHELAGVAASSGAWQTPKTEADVGLPLVKVICSWCGFQLSCWV